MLKFSLTRETKEELVELNNKLEKIRKHLNSIEHFQIKSYEMINKKDEGLKNWLIHERESNKTNDDTILKGYKFKGDYSKMLDNFPYNHWLNDFEVAMVEKALNIQLYPWQKEFLKGSKCVNINKGSGKTYLFTLAYTLKLITLPMFINYDTGVHRCLVSALYHNTEAYIGEMFIDFYEKLSVYPFKLNTTLKLTKEWRV